MALGKDMATEERRPAARAICAQGLRYVYAGAWVITGSLWLVFSEADSGGDGFSSLVIPAVSAMDQIRGFFTGDARSAEPESEVPGRFRLWLGEGLGELQASGRGLVAENGDAPDAEGWRGRSSDGSSGDSLSETDYGN